MNELNAIYDLLVALDYTKEEIQSFSSQRFLELKGDIVKCINIKMNEL